MASQFEPQDDTAGTTPVPKLVLGSAGGDVPWPEAPRQRRPRGLMVLGAAVLLAAAAVVFLAGGGAKPASAVPQPTLNVPITIRGWQGGPDGVTPIVDVRIANGPPLRVLLDTGSTGLNVLARYVPVALRRAAGEAFDETWGQGDVTYEKTAPATVSLDGLATRTPIRVGVVDRLGCAATAPHCQLWSHTFDGIAGTLGISLGPDPFTPNPLLSLPKPYGQSWSVSLSGSSGTLELGAPTPAHPAVSFTVARTHGSASNEQSAAAAAAERKSPTAQLLPTAPEGSPLAPSSGLPTLCWQIKASAEQACVPTAFDTGATDSVIYTDSGAAPNQVVPAGESIAASPLNSTKPFWRFTTGWFPSHDVMLDNGSNLTVMNTGIAAFYVFTVTYVPAPGRMYLSRPAAAAPEPAWRHAATALCQKVTTQLQGKLAAERAAHRGAAANDRTRAVAVEFATMGRLNLDADRALARLSLPHGVARLWMRAIASDIHSSHMLIQFARDLPSYQTPAAAAQALNRFDQAYKRAEQGWSDAMAKLRITDCS